MPYAYNFGAAADGVTDDTDALKHAIEEGGGVLKLSKGTYRITKPLVFDLTKQGYAAILGDGGTARIVMAGPGPAIQVLGDHRGTAQPDTVQKHTWENERFPIVSGIEILGEHPEAIGIQLRKTMQMTVSKVLVRNCKYGVHLIERNRNFLLCDSHIYDNAEYGLFLDRCNLHQINVTGNHISYNKRAGIKSLDGDVHNLQITGNDIEYNNHPGVDESPNGEPTGAEIWFEAPDGVISEVTIASNTIQATVQPGGANIRIHGSGQQAPYGARLLAITGNILGSQTRGIELISAQRVTITGNTIYGAPDLSLFAKHCSGLSMSGNTVAWQGLPNDPPRDGIRIEECDNGVLSGLVTHGLSSGSPEAGAAVTLVDCSDFAVSDCNIVDPRHRGIELENCTRCRVTGNHIIDRREQASMQQAIRIRGGKNNLVRNNTVGGAVGDNILAPPESAVSDGNLDWD